jgi:alpha-D-ribose 1-methylphosphonate 5-triphosphate synthase subunit PhnI
MPVGTVHCVLEARISITVKELLGHSTVTVTMRYTHSNLDSKAVAVRKIEGAATIVLHSAPKGSSSSSQFEFRV